MNQIPHPRPKTLTLLRLIGEWRALTQQQTETIQRADWPGTARLSHAKEKLKELMDAAIMASETDPREDHPPGLQLAVQELVRLEQNNSQLLAERSRELRGRLEQSRAGTRRLRLVGNAYRRERQTRWRSYS